MARLGMARLGRASLARARQGSVARPSSRAGAVLMTPTLGDCDCTLDTGSSHGHTV